MIDLDKIEQVAKAARGRQVEPLHVQPFEKHNGVTCYAVSDRHALWLAECGIGKAFAEHIAACSPDVILALVARIRELEKRAHADDCMGCTRCT